MKKSLAMGLIFKIFRGSHSKPPGISCCNDLDFESYLTNSDKQLMLWYIMSLTFQKQYWCINFISSVDEVCKQTAIVALHIEDDDPLMHPTLFCFCIKCFALCTANSFFISHLKTMVTTLWNFVVTMLLAVNVTTLSLSSHCTRWLME